MSGLILCTKKSDVPYRIKESDINIYSIEELAYYLYNNAYFTDNDFFSEDLIQYIEEKLGLKHIAEKLRTAQSQNLGFVADILIIIQAQKQKCFLEKESIWIRKKFISRFYQRKETAHFQKVFIRMSIYRWR